MRIAYKTIFSATLLSTSACSTLNESMQLGAALGAASGAAVTHSAHRSADAYRKNKAHFRPFCQVTTPVFQLISALIDCGFKRILA